MIALGNIEAENGKAELSKPKLMPYVIRVNEDRVAPLLGFMGKRGLKNMITEPNRYIQRADAGHLKLNSEERALLEEMKRTNDMLRKDGRITDASKYTFHYVKIPQAELNNAVEQSYIHGGKGPESKSVGINVDGTGSKVYEHFEQAIKTGNSAILYVYDKDKLEPLTEEERAAELIMDTGWGMKPKGGLELKDALLEMVVVENSQYL